VAYQEGRQARRDGKARDSNPHPVGTSFHRFWDEGWTDSDQILRSMQNLEEMYGYGKP
jgi:hypothetical protein